MARTLDQIRKLIRTSVHGRRLGLTADADGFLAGPKEMLKTLTNATGATTATALLPYGVHTVTSTSSKNWKLTDPPHPGLTVDIVMNSASTKVHKITPVAATIISSNGIAGANIVLKGKGAAVSLVSVTTAQWAVKSRVTSTSVPSVVVSS